MNASFVDTFYFVALILPGDEAHDSVHQFTEAYDGPLVTTRWVLAEAGNALARHDRQPFLSMVELILADPSWDVLSVNDPQFNAGLDLYRQRPDKAWSLVDCISFAVMTGRGLTDALTADRHFEQAGFNAVLK